MKSLDALLRSLHLKSALQNRVVLNEPWGVTFPNDPDSGKFHFIEAGRAMVAFKGEKPISLRTGDFLVVRGDIEYSIYDVNGTEPTPLVELLRRANVLCESGITLQFGGNGPESSVITGKFLVDSGETHPLWRAFPPYILLRGEEGKAVDWLETTLAFLSCESTNIRPGASAVLDRLCDVLFIQALRGWVQQGDAVAGLPAAMRDPAVDEALDLIHRMPAKDWTVASLADAVAMSRSGFAERFRRLLGESPMGYLLRWRMHQAAVLLRSGRDSVATVAERVGYESEAAFSKAFKREVGMSPGVYRREKAALAS